MTHEVKKLQDEYFDIPLTELSFVMNGIREVEQTEGLKVAEATMIISPEWHSLNCVGVYNVTDIIRRHKSLALWNVARKSTITHSRVVVDIIVEWE